MTARTTIAVLLAVATVATAAGCRVPSSNVTKAGTKALASTAPEMLARPGVAQLTGKVKLIAGAGGALGQGNGASIIANNGGSIVSDHASGVITNNGGNIVSDHAAGYQVQAAAGLATFALADADVTFSDAAGKALAGPDGKPLQARTDAQGAYALRTALPKGNVVAHVRLWNGGELSGLLVPDQAGAATLDLDLASTLSATYVLGHYVKGDQAVLDRLPHVEAERLRQALDVVRTYLGGAPSYVPADMLVATEALRTKEPPVNKAIEDVRALLLGQANLGAGLPATQVPLAAPTGLAWDPSGALLIGETSLGRVRRLTAAGTLETLADAGSGKIPNNFLRLTDLARAADGTLYAASLTTGLYRADPTGHVERILATKEAAAGRDLQPQSLALAADGTLYVGEFSWTASSAAPRVLAVPPGGKAVALAIDATWVGGTVIALVVAPDGGLLVAYSDGKGVKVYKHQDGKAVLVTAIADGSGAADMALAADGTLYLSRPDLHRVDLVAPGKGATPAISQGLVEPRSLAIGPDGTLYVADLGTGLVGARRPDGAWAIVAGSEAVVESGDTTAFGINQPIGLAFDDGGALYIAETGNARVRRFRGGKLEPFAGNVPGETGDGGPATAANLGFPMGIVQAGGEFWLSENTGQRIRHVGRDGVIDSLAAGGPGSPTFMIGQDYPGSAGLPCLSGIARDAAGRLYVSSNGHQVLRYTPDAEAGKIRVMAGRHRADTPDVFSPGPYLGDDETKQGALLGMPMGVAVAPDGSPCFAELVTCRVMRVVGQDGPAPTLQRIAGIKLVDMLAAAGGGKLGDEEHARADATALIFPTSVVFDAAGNLYVAEAGTIHIGALTSVGNATGGGGSAFGTDATSALGLPRIAGRVRKISPDGTISTVAGRGSRFFPDDSGDNALILPMGLAIAADGRMAISDTGANTVRILPAGSY
ncbi:MAG: repeat containing protein [Cyanobacteria bacterium RYN_339]|nr:repeat containing protein [Cyanobacteria bacterium RYN_339]